MSEEKHNEMLSGKVCPYCNSETEYIDSECIYGKSYGMIYICKPCDAFVGVYRGTDSPLGRLADKSLREAKKRAHFYFDRIWREKIIIPIYLNYDPSLNARRNAYNWLSIRLDIEPKRCHIGMMDVEQCNRVVDICKPYLYNKNAHLYNKYNKK